MLDLYEWAYKDADDDPEFVKQEKEIEDLLLSSALLLLPQGQQIFRERTGGRVASVDTARSALEAMTPTMSLVHTYEVNDKYLKIVDRGILQGSRDANAGDAVKNALFKEDVKEGIVASSKYYTNKYFKEQVIPQTVRAAEKAISGGATSREVFDQLQQKIDDHYGNARYWKMVANTSASRGYHYGLCKGGVYAGYTRVTYSAVLDARTSQVCRGLDGRTWSIHDAVDILEHVAMADPEEVKRISPWLGADEYEGLTNAELADMGVICPPRHPYCRSVLVLS